MTASVEILTLHDQISQPGTNMSREPSSSPNPSDLASLYGFKWNKITSEVLIGTVKFSEQGSAGAVSRISGDRLSATWAPGSVMAGRKYSAEPARTPLLSVHRVKS